MQNLIMMISLIQIRIGFNIMSGNKRIKGLKKCSDCIGKTCPMYYDPFCPVYRPHTVLNKNDIDNGEEAEII